MTITERLQKYMEYKGLNANQVTVEANLSVGLIGKSIKNNRGLNSDTIEKILYAFQDLSPEWLIIETGEMIKSKGKNIVTDENSNKNSNIISNNPNVLNMLPLEGVHPIASPDTEYGKIMRKLKFAEGVNVTDHGAPFYDLPVSAGRVHELIGMQENPTGYISMPGVNCDAFFPITGASFEPYIRAGDIIGINFIDKWENLDPDCVYLIITYDQRMLKRLMKHPTDSTLLICISPNYKEFEIDKFTIRYIHKVTFCGRPV
ncbi:S24 family peptidase [Chryseobacterium arthrosphaerae]|uniref:S24 family peptidase n=1 Tax=Chryseobacterium arthrosphaerae TaxID=651561 RepID=A0ABU7R2T0_9FLAO